MPKYTVLIEGETVGTCIAEVMPSVGDVVTIETCDDGGIPFETSGAVVEVLETQDPDDKWARYMGMEDCPE